MRKISIYLICICLSVACGKKKGSDVSHIKVPLQLERFEQDFFAVDTARVDPAMQQLHEKYPHFLSDFVFNILGLPAQPDSNLAVEAGIRSFISTYQPLKDTADKVFKDMDALQAEIVSGLQHVKYYFPNYPLPQKLITFIGPLNSFGNILTPDALAVGLQLYLGKNFSLYQSAEVQQLYPAYVSRRFEPAYIPVNAMKNVVDDLYPDRSVGRPLVEQMVEAGKRLYLLDRLLPNVADTLKTGYTQQQLEGAYEHEELIWSFFLQNDLLYAIEPAVTQDYMNDGPKTPALGEESPGFIGQFVGWQIVKKYMDKHADLTMEALLKTPAKTIFEQAKYKP